ncbi:hypothetical protein HRbin20_00913 [bacterium HR20]|jgi:hypothetical protein|nr:hypothetical protein HRbin20_00913 [bacterium HR20]GIV55966.1 MAG: hypothetical protein KatS3mg040_0734 [Candidatus Kapabacteria bacterium]
MKMHENDFLIAIADGRASNQELERYQQLRQAEPRVELYVALLRATRARLQRAAAQQPQAVPASLLERIRQQTSQPANVIGNLTRRWWWVAAAAAAILIVIIAPWRSKATDFREESLQNFQLIMSGKLSVAKASQNFDELVAFFRSQGVTYNLVNVPLRAQLVGGVVSEHNGTKLAHLVYRRGDTLIYMYQAPEELFKRGILALPRSVMHHAETGEWYAENVAHATWMFWRVQSVYCSVVANVPKDVLATYFVEGAI